MTFKKNRHRDLVYYTIPSFEKTGLVKHGFSTRLGGVSKAPLNSLNLGIKKRDKKENLYENYEIFCKSLEISVKNLVLSDQTHEDHVFIAGKKDCKEDIFQKGDIIGVDALITNERNVALVTFSADCVPLFFLDPEKKVIGLTHAGWRGTMKKIGQRTLQKMHKTYGTDPRNCMIAIGPSIGPCCFEVEKEVIEQIHANFTHPQQYYRDKGGEKYMVDLWKLNKNQLLEIGVQENNITMSNICTKCNKDLFYSHRGDQGQTGSLAAIMQLV